jgi:hypothetical protein
MKDQDNSPMPFAVGDTLVLVRPAIWSKPDGSDFTATEIMRGDFGSGFGARVTPAIQEHHPDKCDVWYDTDHFRLRI